MPQASPLGPVDPASVPDGETEKSAPWIIRKLAGSMTGRIVMSSYESLRAAGTSVVCLSPWGDSSPILFPCIRFRDLAMHAVIAGTGGMAAIAAPVMGPVSDVVLDTFGDTILVEIGMHTGFELTTKAANDLLLEHPLKQMIPIHAETLTTTAIKAILITLKYKHTVEDASLGFYRSSVHADATLFATVKDYLAIEKGWFSPYLFASGRRPIIPRTITPDFVFCHGPFLSGDYRIGETLLKESAISIILCGPPARVEPDEHPATLSPPPSAHSPGRHNHFDFPALSKYLPPSRSPSPSAGPRLTALPQPPVPRRIVILLLGLKPHRGGMWTSSQRPGESVMNYLLLNGCPAVVVPARLGAPLLAWDVLTLGELQKLEVPADGKVLLGGKGEGGFFGAVSVLFEYIEMCIDWDRVLLQPSLANATAGVAVENLVFSKEQKERAVRDALTLLLTAAVRSKASKEVKADVDNERAGIALFRIP